MLIKKQSSNYLLIFLYIVFLYIILDLNITYKTNHYDLSWVPSIQVGYSQIYKEYFLDFFNSFYLYDIEIGYNHSYYHINPFNPFYSLSFLGLEDYSIKVLI